MQRGGSWYNPATWGRTAPAVSGAPLTPAAPVPPAVATVQPETTRLGLLQTVQEGKNWMRANAEGILPGEDDLQKVWTGRSGSSEKRLKNRNPNTSFVNREFDEYNISNPSWKTLKNEKGAYVKPTSLKKRLSKGRFYGKNPIAAQNTFTRFAQTYNPSQLVNYTRRYTNATKKEKNSWNSIKKGMNSETSKSLSTMDSIFQKYVTGLTNTLKARHTAAKKRYEAFRRAEIQKRADIVRGTSGWSPEPVASEENMKQPALDLIAELQDTARTFNPENPSAPVKPFFSLPTFGLGAKPAASNPHANITASALAAYNVAHRRVNTGQINASYKQPNLTLRKPVAAAPPAPAAPPPIPSMTSAINALKKLNTRNKLGSSVNNSSGKAKPSPFNVGIENIKIGPLKPAPAAGVVKPLSPPPAPPAPAPPAPRLDPVELEKQLTSMGVTLPNSSASHPDPFAGLGGGRSRKRHNRKGKATKRR